MLQAIIEFQHQMVEEGLSDIQAELMGLDLVQSTGFLEPFKYDPGGI